MLFSLSKQFPRLCACLKLTAAGKDRCLICEEKEKANFERCETEGCKFIYCPECWEDINVSNNTISSKKLTSHKSKVVLLIVFCKIQFHSLPPSILFQWEERLIVKNTPCTLRTRKDHVKFISVRNCQIYYGYYKVYCLF